MRELSDQELDMRIESFLKRKHEQFPELRIRPEKNKKTAPDSLVDTFLDLAAGIKLQLTR